MRRQSGQSNVFLEELSRCVIAFNHSLCHRLPRNRKASSKSSDSPIKICVITAINQIRHASAQRPTTLNRNSEQGRVRKIDPRPFCSIKIPLRQGGDTCNHVISELLPLFPRTPQFYQERLGERRTSLFWKGVIQLVQIVIRRGNVTIVGEEEQPVRSLSYEPPLDRRRKYGCKNRRNCSDSGPSIPVNSASTTQQPALAYAVQHAHSLPSLWTRRHSPMTRQLEAGRA